MNMGKLSVLCLMLVSTPSLATTTEARDWINKIHQSVRHTSYQGTFVYRQGDQMEVMRIVHRADENGIKERLLSLNGWAREIIRNNDEVVCYLPDKKAVMVGHRAAEKVEKKFPSLLPGKVDQLNDTYTISVTRAERIAGRKTALVSIAPKDNMRYGYRLWADDKTGLLLKSDLLDNMGNMIEQFMFTDIRIGQPIEDKDLLPSYSGKEMVWHRSKKEVPDQPAREQWQVRELPAGYRVSERMVRMVPGKKMPVTHLLVSDGLAAVSVFIEKKTSGKKAEPMVTSMGAAHAYRGSVDGHQITAVGEVPAATVEQIGRSVKKE